jgi:HK97 family phage major capsid protein
MNGFTERRLPMKLTKELKAELTTVCGVKAESTDDEFVKAAGDAFANGKLSPARYAELTKEPGQAEADAFSAKLDKVADGLEKLVAHLTKEPEAKPEVKEVKTETKEVKVSNLSKLIADIGRSSMDAKDVDVRVKEAAEQYDATKSAAIYPSTTKSGRPHPLAGRPVYDFTDEGRPVQETSQRDKAVIGAWCKLLCATKQRGGSRTFGYQSLPDHDKSLLHYAMDQMEWSGASDGGDHADIKHRRLTPHEQKALIDDAVSGGLEAAPIVFDDQVISAPLLYGELYPLVNTVPIPRGRRVEGVAVGQVTGSWGGVDATAISLFNTASYVSAFDTTIFRWQGAIQLGLDFLSDSPINFGQIVTQQYGEQLLNDLDDVIATGNGTTQPEGVMNKATATSVAWGGTTSIGNYESLRFGVAKAEHRPNLISSAVFCGSETTYQRAKAIPLGATDARRLFGEGGMGTGGYANYSLMGHGFKINTSMANTQVFYAILGRYRMFRREGLTMRTSTEGDTLTRANELLMVAVARYGGQLERGACAAITTTAPA